MFVITEGFDLCVLSGLVASELGLYVPLAAFADEAFKKQLHILLS